MHTKIRRSALKARKMKGFRRKMKTKAGRQIVNRQRARAIGKAKHTKSRRGKDRKRVLRTSNRS
jgi:ribosomal protein L34